MQVPLAQRIAVLFYSPAKTAGDMIEILYYICVCKSSVLLCFFAFARILLNAAAKAGNNAAKTAQGEKSRPAGGANGLSLYRAFDVGERTFHAAVYADQAAV